jgi:hypothetical protein
MAARLNRMDTERVLTRIRLSQLVNRLQDNALGKLKYKGQQAFMTADQIRCATFLIERKIARAEAPKYMSVDFAGRIEVEFV